MYMYIYMYIHETESKKHHIYITFHHATIPKDIADSPSPKKILTWLVNVPIIGVLIIPNMRNLVLPPQGPIKRGDACRPGK
jgi:hypothetical protein